MFLGSLSAARTDILGNTSKRNMIFPEFNANGMKGCLIVIVSFCFAIQRTLSTIPPKFNICNHRDCEATGYEILQYGNSRINPCDDFYEHSCGHYTPPFEVKQNVTTYNYIRMLEEATKKQLRGLLEEDVNDNNSGLEIQAKTTYEACMKTAETDRQNADSVVQFLRNLGGWPMIKGSRDVPEHMDWIQVHNYLHATSGVGSLINVLVYGDYFTDNTPTIHLDQPSTVFGRYNYISKEDIEVYTRFLLDLATDFIKWSRSDASLGTVERQVAELIEFRQSLVKIMSWGNERRNETRKNNQFSFEFWQQMSDTNAHENNYINLNWLNFVHNLFGDNIPLQSSQKIIVSEVNYLTKLLRLLKGTPKHIILNHMHLHFIERHLKYMTTNMMERDIKLNEEITGISAVLERWRFCLVENPLPHIVAHMYVKKYINAEARAIVSKIAEDIRMSFVIHISKFAWMDKKTKEKALLKIRNLRIVVGYPDFYYNQTMLNLLYDDLSIGHYNLWNALAFENNEFRIKVMNLRGWLNDDNIDNIPTDVNVFYDFSQNVLHVNAAILQRPFYSAQLPHVVLYATIGNVIGQEMAHVFDDIGRYFDEDGTPSNWWRQKTAETYDEKINCIIEQYHTYAARNASPILTVDRRNTAAKVIANAAGMRAAFAALIRDSKRQAFETGPKLPGLAHIKDVQMFFSASATVSCEKMAPFDYICHKDDEELSLQRFIVNIPMSESQSFSRAYNCTPGQTMNPSAKCNIWMM